MYGNLWVGKAFLSTPRFRFQQAPSPLRPGTRAKFHEAEPETLQIKFIVSTFLLHSTQLRRKRKISIWTLFMLSLSGTASAPVVRFAPKKVKVFLEEGKEFAKINRSHWFEIILWVDPNADSEAFPRLVPRAGLFMYANERFRHEDKGKRNESAKRNER